ncbi:MAG TPA: hypothetical protein VFZ54_19970 [Burkholderiales bacterium]
MARKATALAIIALLALVAAALFLLSVHGPAGLGVAAPIYLVIGAALMWWAGRRSWPALLVAAVVALAAAPGLYLALDKVERFTYERRIARTQVAEVRDEPILVANRPIGVRLSYRVTSPAWGHFAIFPAIHGSGDAAGFGLQAKRWTFDGRGGIEFGPFEPGKRHDVTVELYPESFFLGSSGTCILPVVRPLPEAREAAPLRVEIYESPYGSEARGGREERTLGAYDMATLYRNVVASGLPPCKVPGQ